MNGIDAGRVQNAYRFHYLHPNRGSSGRPSAAVGRIVGIAFGSFAGACVLAFVIFLIVEHYRKAKLRRQAAQEAEATNPSTTQPPYGTTSSGAYEMQPTGGNAEAAVPPTAAQPAITPLGVQGGNPYSPNGANYVYGTPMAAVPPQQHVGSSTSDSEGSAVHYFKEMNETATGAVQNVYYYYSDSRSGSSMSVSTIVGIIFASVGGVIIVVSLVCVIVQCCRKAQQQQVAQGAEVTYPSATQPPYATTTNGGGYDMQQMGSNAAAMVPPTAVQPAIAPLGVPGGNPFSPNGANYAYGTPMGAAPPPLPANEYGNGVYYQRAPEALVEQGAPAQPQHAGTAPSNPNDSAVYCFKNVN